MAKPWRRGARVMVRDYVELSTAAGTGTTESIKQRLLVLAFRTKYVMTLVDDSIASLLTDAHAHPTDDPRLKTADVKEGVKALAERLLEVPLGRVCAMSSCTDDQALVRELALEVKRQQELQEQKGEGKGIEVRPCFGYHPWYSHTISLLDEAPSREDHYRSILLNEKSSSQAKEELEALLPHLPEPRTLKSILTELRTHLEEFPTALLGEVGLDRAFRIPAGKDSVKDQPSERGLLASNPPQPTNGNGNGNDNDNSYTLALRGKKLTTLSVPITHQHSVVLAQIGLAVSLGRSISFHSVRAPDATVHLLREACRIYNGASTSGLAFRDISLDLHSCTLSHEMLASILSTHENVFVSFSTTINLRQKGLEKQLGVVPPTRMLVESDWHTAGELGERNGEMLRIAAPYVAREKPDEVKEEGASEEDLMEAAKLLARNWERFDNNRKAKGEDDSDDDDDGAEDEAEEARRAFEANWWKQLKSKPMK